MTTTVQQTRSQVLYDIVRTQYEARILSGVPAVLDDIDDMIIAAVRDLAASPPVTAKEVRQRIIAANPDNRGYDLTVGWLSHRLHFLAKEGRLEESRVMANPISRRGKPYSKKSYSVA